MKIQDHTIRFEVKVITKSSRQSIGAPGSDGRLRVWVNVAPEQGKANKAVLKLLMKEFKVKPQEIVIVQGQTSPLKTIQITPPPDQWSRVVSHWKKLCDNTRRNASTD